MQETYMGPPVPKGAQVKVPSAPEVVVPTGKAPEQPVAFEQPRPTPPVSEPVVITKMRAQVDKEQLPRFGQPEAYASESSKWRHIAAPYLRGNGIELATGGDPIVPTSIQFELTPTSYATYNSGQPLRGVVHWRSDTAVFNLPFKDGVLDYVASSHLIEDFADWEPLLREWVRVLKPGGRLLICAPEKKRWAQALANGQCPNCQHRREPYLGEFATEIAKLRLPISTICEKLTNVPEGDYNILYCGERI
jgi:hypothetical protein